MPPDCPIHTAQIIAFEPRRSEINNRFTVADKMELLRWEAGNDAEIRLTIYKRREGDPPEVDEYASIYPVNENWAAWGAVRKGTNISIWRSHDGREFGPFQTMTEALEAVAHTEKKRFSR